MCRWLPARGVQLLSHLRTLNTPSHTEQRRRPRSRSPRGLCRWAGSLHAPRALLHQKPSGGQLSSVGEPGPAQQAPSRVSPSEPREAEAGWEGLPE